MEISEQPQCQRPQLTFSHFAGLSLLSLCLSSSINTEPKHTSEECGNNQERETQERDMDDRTPGFRFYPTEEELVSFYLHNKLEGTRQDLDRAIPVVDIYKYNPWDLPRELCQGDPEQWFFFFPRQEREVHGGRPNRLTTIGYWKATGSPGYVYSNNRIIGVKRTMVFYTGRAPGGRKTEWKMNEYKAIAGEDSSSTSAAPKVYIKYMWD
ncbi:unnamed protein product [Ilex paraguariensis]|uniref:NAC domain-containing protein n=2 Tax=Ilex paraguariensis TaxID=185542 RepID=A0ABC8SDS6_9AQUA